MTLCSRPRALASTGSASTMTCRPLLRRLSISRSRYVLFVLVTYYHIGDPGPSGGILQSSVKGSRLITHVCACLQVENEERAQLPSRQGASPEQASALEESIFKLSAQLSTITRNQKYFRTRENRNFSTVRSTERRIFNFSVIEGLMMVSMAALQVFVVRFFFQGARKGKCRFPFTIEFRVFFVGYVLFPLW